MGAEFKRGLAVALAICAIAAPRFATAQPEAAAAPVGLTQAQKLETARKHFDAGDKHLDAGRFAEAISEFEKSYLAAGRPSAVFMLAVAYRKRFEAEGALADARLARKNYERFLDKAPDHPKVEEAREQVLLLDGAIARAEAAKAKGLPTESLTGSRAYREAVGLLGDGKYKSAVAKADEARKVAGATRSELARIWVVKARALALQGAKDDAVVAFERALSLEPEIEPVMDIDAPDATAYAKAKRRLRGKAPLSISFDAPEVVRAGKPVAIKANIESDPTKMIVRMAIRYRRRGTESFSEIVGKPNESFSIPMDSIPGESAEDRLLFYVVAFDDAGAAVATASSARSPARVEILDSGEWNARFAEPTPIYKKWWFWTAAGVVASVGASVLYFTLQPETGDGEHIDTPLGPVLRF